MLQKHLDSFGTTFSEFFDRLGLQISDLLEVQVTIQSLTKNLEISKRKIPYVEKQALISFHSNPEVKQLISGLARHFVTDKAPRFTFETSSVEKRSRVRIRCRKPCALMRR